ncbi:MAG: hypothetical protein J6Y90_05455 [Lachnospiraceae bacterium]|nr:hypothetical protein [Lachnospiraceae bacterium]
MKKSSPWKRFRYWFDNLMSKGTSSLLLLLAVITTVVVIIGAVIAMALGGADGTGADSAGKSIWFTLMHAINTGVLAKEEGTVPYLAVMAIVTLVGMFITSFLIGTISNGIKDKVNNLRRGKSRVIEEGHVIIIGFDENIISIIEELALANANRRDAVVVVLAEKDKIDMEEIISERVGDIGNLRVVCRSGRPDSPKDLKVCSLDTCKSIIVNLDDDFMTVKTILACESLLDEYGNHDAYITAVVRDREVLHPAKIAGGSRAEILNFQKTIARLMVQSGRHPGMSEILSELLSFKGNEIYVVDNPSMIGLTLKEINLRLPHSTAIGMVREDIPLLNPDAAAVVEQGDHLILIAKDDSMKELQAAAAVDEGVFEREPNLHEDPHTLLILGYTDMLKQILIEDDAYAAPGSKVIIAAEPGKIDLDALPSVGELKNLEVSVQECKIFKRKVLEKLVANKPSGIMLMSDPELDDEEADARTLMLQLHLTDIAEEIGADIPLTIEMNSTRNQRLSQMMRATDFVVSSSITAKMMAQIAEQRHKKAIINDLLSEGGSSIYMKPITRYVTTGKPVDFYTLGASAARYGEIAIGYKKFAADGSFSIEVNPYSREAEKFSDKDDLIVVAKN